MATKHKSKKHKLSNSTKYVLVAAIAAVVFSMYFATGGNVGKFTAGIGGIGGIGGSVGSSQITITPEICTDNADNDLDGNIDCSDSDCADKACTNNAILCNVGSTGGGPSKICKIQPRQNLMIVRACVINDAAVCKETACADGLDNDNDGKKDCLDTDCNKVGICEFGKELTCNDAKDNDVDGLTDCKDPDCNKIGSCEFGKELNCKDKIDNDADGKTDNKDCDCTKNC